MKQKRPVDELYTEVRWVYAVSDLSGLSSDTEAIGADPLTDEVAARLRTFPNLRLLMHSGNSAITDAGVAELSHITTLEALDLECSSGITDGALAQIGALPTLRYLDISFCRQLTSEGVDGFVQSHPAVEVER